MCPHGCSVMCVEVGLGGEVGGLGHMDLISLSTHGILQISICYWPVFLLQFTVYFLPEFRQQLLQEFLDAFAILLLRSAACGIGELERHGASVMHLDLQLNLVFGVRRNLLNWNKQIVGVSEAQRIKPRKDTTFFFVVVDNFGSWCPVSMCCPLNFTLSESDVSSWQVLGGNSIYSLLQRSKSIFVFIIT